MNDPTSWNPDFGSFDVGDPKLAKEIEKRWNAYPGLIHALKECHSASDDSHVHAMIDDILGTLGEINEDGTFR
jgi:hypothetical protein